MVSNRNVDIAVAERTELANEFFTTFAECYGIDLCDFPMLSDEGSAPKAPSIQHGVCILPVALKHGAFQCHIGNLRRFRAA
jgi:hypothetical protein